MKNHPWFLNETLKKKLDAIKIDAIRKNHFWKDYTYHIHIYLPEETDCYWTNDSLK